MTDDIVHPKILSMEFHMTFFPQLIRSRFQPEKSEGTTFVSHSFMEGAIGLAICLILAAIGIPMVIKLGSILGWILSILGVGGMAALIGFSIYSQRGISPSYRNFQFGIFAFIVSLGFSSGVLAGLDSHSAWLGASTSVAGLCAGYMLGIIAGLWFQYLGWIVSVVNVLAGFAAIVMGVADLFLLFMPAR